MEIRKAKNTDFESIKRIYHRAREYMAANGNPNQWGDGYPFDDTILDDIANNNCHLMEHNGEIQGVFVFIIGEDPTYKVIKNGSWTSNQVYGTIHRIASAGMMKQIAKTCFDFCSSKVDYLRIDTHSDNKTMQAAIKKYGFRYCGLIYVRNGERLAFDYLK